MSQTLFIALLVLVVAIFVFLYRRKKKVENKMGDELNALIESDDSSTIYNGGAYFLCTYNYCCVYSLEIL